MDCFGLHFHFYVLCVMMLWPTFVVLVVDENSYKENLCRCHPIKHGKGLLVRIMGFLSVQYVILFRVHYVIFDFDSVFHLICIARYFSLSPL